MTEALLCPLQTQTRIMLAAAAHNFARDVAILSDNETLIRTNEQERKSAGESGLPDSHISQKQFQTTRRKKNVHNEVT